MTDAAALYAQARARVTKLLSDVSEEDAKTPVATCPNWNVHDVVAHLAGVCADVLSGNIAGVASDPWTAAQVDARRERTLAEIVAEWNEVAPQVEAFANNFPGRVSQQFLTDGITHEHDIRLALGRPGERDCEAVRVGADFMVMGFGAALRAYGLGPLEVSAGDQSWVVGGGERVADDAAVAEAVDAALSATLLEGELPTSADPPVATLEASPFELMRAFTGRRSTAQIAAMSWSVDPSPFLPALQFGPFTTSPVDIDE